MSPRPVRKRRDGRYAWRGPRGVPRWDQGVRKPGTYLLLDDGHNAPPDLLPALLPDEPGAAGPLLGPLELVVPGEHGLFVAFERPRDAKRYRRFLPFAREERAGVRLPYLPGTRYVLLGGVVWREAVVAPANTFA